MYKRHLRCWFPVRRPSLDKQTNVNEQDNLEEEEDEDKDNDDDDDDDDDDESICALSNYVIQIPYVTCCVLS